ncbi:DNA polymerase/3'-5' exonuclease PolX [Fontivita pretiosa]|uniref:DNA polymerase/3'-5' exonuclease PolX n=1 Tax=Fontivita pretiosa TaxID=2989684 RepID=UPI003D16C3BA
MSLNQELSQLFRTLSAIMEIRGEPVFKAIAFSKVSRILENLPIDIRAAVEDGTIEQIEGIGPHSRRIIEEYVRTGRSSDYDQAIASIPEGLIPMLQIPGLGPKTIALFWKERGITNLEELTRALEDGSLKGLKGIGEKKLEAIRQGIRMRAQAAQRMGIGEALPVAEQLLAGLRALKQVTQAEIAGSLRRRKETIGDVDLVCACKDGASGAQITSAFTRFPEVSTVLGEGPTKASIVTASGLQVDLRVVPEENFGAALLYFTGSKDHNVRVRGLAQEKGMTLNEWGLYKLQEYEKIQKKPGEAPKLKPLASRTEAEIYRKLGMSYIEPELREDRGEVELALKHKLPKLIERADYRGDLHCHSTASDGTASIEQMAEAAIALGYEYLGITDHSKSQVIANGLSPERLLAHVREIRRISDRFGRKIKLLAGAEVDILVDGRLDYEDAILAELDFVIASPHVSLKQESDKATDRILRAIENRYVNIIGHPTGRLINSRPGLPLDFARIYKAAADSGTALEINAGYPRLDLNDIHSRGAIDAGVMLSINTDAHSTQGFNDIVLGLSVARRAWVTRHHVINCLPLSKLQQFFARKR